MAYPTNTWSFSLNAANLAVALNLWTVTHVGSADAHGLASQSKAGFMSPLDKAKLDSLGGGAGDIDAGSINTVHLANGAVTTEKIAEGVTITGTLVGNASTATKATKDAQGNTIAEFYAPLSALGSYVQTGAFNDALALKANASTAATKTELQQGLATKQPTGDYVLFSTYESGLSGKQDKGDYATTKALTDGLATKQAVGDYVTSATFNEELNKKQPVGDYVTPGALNSILVGYVTDSDLEDSLAGKQPVGNYVTDTELEQAIAGVQVTDGSITVSKLADTIDLGGLS